MYWISYTSMVQDSERRVQMTVIGEEEKVRAEASRLWRRFLRHRLHCSSSLPVHLLLPRLLTSCTPRSSFAVIRWRNLLWINECGTRPPTRLLSGKAQSTGPSAEIGEMDVAPCPFPWISVSHLLATTTNHGSMTIYEDG